ncbi:hypothetical protein MASR2M48_19540 [Spirochaetota bacterium]
MIGIIGVSSGVMGYLVCRSLVWERIIMAAGGILMIYPGTMTDVIGVSLIAAGAVSQVLRSKAQKKQVA